MFVSIICMAFGGYILINSNLKSLLNNEVQMAYDYGDMVYYSLANELKTTQATSHYIDVNEYSEDPDITMNQVASSININNMNQIISFGVLSDEGKVIYTSLTENLDKNILSTLEENKKCWILKDTKQGFYVQALRPALYQNKTYYIETIRDVQYIFDGEKLQYETLLKIMFGLIFFAGLFTLIVSKLLVRRIVSLTKVTKDISSGRLKKRAIVNGGDEIAILTENFNVMADELEDKMQALKDEAEKKELFVGAFSHELKTPLTSIIGYSDMLRKKELDKDQLKLCANYIFEEGKRLEHLSMRLMDLIVLKNQDLNLEPVNIKDFFNNLCFEILPQLKPLNIQLSNQVEEATIYLEPDLIKTVFINLIDNSKKAIGFNGSIAVYGKWQYDSYIISISDTGKGMEQQELSKIKEAFYMVDKSRSRMQGGVGLGLAICDAILALHNFEIHFESEVNLGTTVSIIIKGWKND